MAGAAALATVRAEPGPQPHQLAERAEEGDQERIVLGHRVRGAQRA